MPLSRQLPTTDNATKEDGPAPDDSRERTPDDTTTTDRSTATDRDTATGHGDTSAGGTDERADTGAGPDDAPAAAGTAADGTGAGEKPPGDDTAPAGERSRAGDGADHGPEQPSAEEESAPAGRPAGTENPAAGTGTVDPADEPAPARTPDGPAAGGDDGTAVGAPGGSRPAGTPGRRGRRDPRGRWRAEHPAAARVLTYGATALAVLFVFAALVMPNGLSRFTPFAFTRVPGEAVVAAAVLLFLPPRPRRWVAALSGAGLGLLLVLKFVDIGFYAVLSRPFDLVLDWILFEDGHSFLEATIGGTGATAAVIGAVTLAAAVPVLMTLAVIRLSEILARHRTTATRTTFVVAIVWITCSAIGLRIGSTPVASSAAAKLVKDRVNRVEAGIKDERKFARVAAVDDFGDTPPDELLTALRGKDVLFAFIESYGRVAIDENPEMSRLMSAALAEDTDRLDKAGFSSRSGFLRSPTTGAGSWLAHSTLWSGLWVDNQRRYRTVTASDRLTLTGAFQRSGAWRTVGMMPGVTRAWPEGKFYDFDAVYDSKELGYRGPKFSWSPVPDQYTLSAFERLERAKRDRDPLMAGIILATSHNPWAPIPRMIGWDEVGNGSVYHAMKEEGKDPEEVWKDPEQVRTEYRRAVEYSMDSLVSYLEEYGDEDTVLVVLGDHQPVPTVAGDGASRDVPVSIVAHDEAVLDRISDWEWDEGLKPGPDAPVWRMDTFRDRFLTAYGPEAEAPSASEPESNADAESDAGKNADPDKAAKR
ncbi:sulfatase [Streptomyces sp. S07_1.15]|uniref:sulfatase n=1 Tax=Streptomyces sp. S07_1.15 TaxID=2873925 RepID=UPI001D13A006|nr:sulfatase [Streptomyces sp. S07_1.15]MCC3654351.1 sulfatase [Streptomyces sp. S07_1.15]